MKDMVELELNEQTAKQYYLKMKDIFKKIINNDKEEFIYREEFNWDDIEEKHRETTLEMSKNGEDFFSFYFQRKIDHRYYAFEISNNFLDFGFCYQPESKDLFFCELAEFYNYIGDTRMIINFIYNKKTDEIIEVHSLTRYSSPLLDKKIIRSAEDKILKKIL